jgi:hypothetical protein
MELTQKAKCSPLNEKYPSAYNDEKTYNIAVTHIEAEDSDCKYEKMKGAKVKIVIHAGHTDQNEENGSDVLDIENMMVVGKPVLQIRQSNGY